VPGFFKSGHLGIKNGTEIHLTKIKSPCVQDFKAAPGESRGLVHAQIDSLTCFAGVGG